MFQLNLSRTGFYIYWSSIRQGVGVQRRVRVEKAKILLCVLDRKLSILFLTPPPRQGQIPLLHTLTHPFYLYPWSEFLWSNFWGTHFTKSFPPHWMINEDRDVNKGFKLMSKWTKGYVCEFMLSSMPSSLPCTGATERNTTEGAWL